MEKLTMKQACKELGVSRPTLQEMINVGDISRVKVNKHYYILRGEMDSFWSRAMVTSDAPNAWEELLKDASVEQLLKIKEAMGNLGK